MGDREILMNKKLTREEYNELYAEFEFNEADSNHNGVISRKEELDAHKNAKIGSLMKPIAGENIEKYKERILDILNKFSKVTSEQNGKFQKIRELLKRRSENLLGTRYDINQDETDELYDNIKEIYEK